MSIINVCKCPPSGHDESCPLCTPLNAEDVLTDFREWSGGHEPWECSHEELFAYAIDAKTYDFLMAQREPAAKPIEPMHQPVVADDACGDTYLSDARGLNNWPDED